MSTQPQTITLYSNKRYTKLCFFFFKEREKMLYTLCNNRQQQQATITQKTEKSGKSKCAGGLVV